MSAKIMVLGVYHFEERNKGTHLIEPNIKDILSDEKQQELQEVIHCISNFNPTKIAVEVNNENTGRLNEQYHQYQKDPADSGCDFIPVRNEVFQLAFPMAKKFNHDNIYAINYPVLLPSDLIENAKEEDPEIFNAFMKDAQALRAEIDQKMQNGSVLDILRFLNDPVRVKAEHSDLYLRMAQIGANTNYDGAYMLSEWYKRNLYIFGNLQRTAENDDRILVIYGAGHIKTLSNLIEDYSGMELVDTMTYLV